MLKYFAISFNQKVDITFGSAIFNHMVEYQDEAMLSEILKSMSDPTRRSLLTRVCQDGPCRVTDLAALYEVSLNAISKHLKVLEKCGLIIRTTSGRTHWIEANLNNIKIVENWFKELESIWELRLDTFSALIENNWENEDE